MNIYVLIIAVILSVQIGIIIITKPIGKKIEKLSFIASVTTLVISICICSISVIIPEKHKEAFNTFCFGYAIAMFLFAFIYNIIAANDWKKQEAQMKEKEATNEDIDEEQIIKDICKKIRETLKNNPIPGTTVQILDEKQTEAYTGNQDDSLYATTVETKGSRGVILHYGADILWTGSLLVPEDNLKEDEDGICEAEDGIEWFINYMDYRQEYLQPKKFNK